MIIILVNASVEESNVTSFERKLNEVALAALELPGCTSYDWYRNPVNKNGYLVYGEFNSIEDFKTYKESSVVKMIVRELIPLTNSKPKFRHFDGEVFEEG